MANSVASSALAFNAAPGVGPGQEQVITQWYTSSVSAATIGWVVTPFQCQMKGYWTQDAAAVAAANNVLVYSGSSASGGLLATISVSSGGGPGDTTSWACATVNTVIAGGQPISFNFNTTVLGTAYGQMVTVMFTKV